MTFCFVMALKSGQTNASYLFVPLIFVSLFATHAYSVSLVLKDQGFQVYRLGIKTSDIEYKDIVDFFFYPTAVVALKSEKNILFCNS